MIDRVLQLAQALRRHDIDVSASEVVDALQALSVIELDDRQLVRQSLRACMVKIADDEIFDQCFDHAFAIDARFDDPLGGLAHRRDPDSRSADQSAVSAPEMNDAIREALMTGSADALAALAAQAVGRFAGLADAEGSERYFMHRVLRAIDLSRMLSAAMQQLRAGGEMDELQLMLVRNELTARLDEFRRLLAAEIVRHRSARDPHSSTSGEIPERTRPEDIDLLALSRAGHDDVRRALQPMIRRLATRIGRRRRVRSTGRVDVRRTVRRSLQSGGVPIDVVNRRRHPHRPDLVVLCDVSGSVAEFAQFTFTLINALHADVRDVRSFAFVDGIAEVTDLFRTATHDIAVNRLVERKGVVGLDGHSDYGAVFAQFVSEHLDDTVGPRTNVIICGDARGNHRDAHVESFAAISRRARRVYWLNPEPRVGWGVDDSLTDTYSPWCRAIYEVRSLAQLEAAIAELV